MALIGLALVAGTGCAPSLNTALRQPSASEPHGTVTITREYAARPGPKLEEFGSINGLEAPATFRAPPGDAVVFLDATFFHFEEKREWVTRSYTVYETRDEQRYEYCASRDSSNRCISRTETVRVTVPRTEYRRELEVTITRVNDARCKVDVPFAIHPGTTYHVRYVWEGDNTCHASCEVRAAGSAGECPLPPKVTRGTHAVPRERVSRPLAPIGLGAVAVGGIGVVTGLFFMNAAAGEKTAEKRDPLLLKGGLILGIAAPIFIGGIVVLALPGKRVVEVVPAAAGASLRGTF